MIVEVVHDIVETIVEYGSKHNDTKEIVGFVYSIDDIAKVNLEEEKESVESLMPNFDARYEDEKDHYLFLKHGLIHKVKEVTYFHKCGPDNRKIIIFSNDCISSIQWVYRPEEEKVELIVHMRSSDAVNLLPMDLLYLTDMFIAVNDLYIPNWRKRFEAIMLITVGSVHYYISGGRNEDNIDPERNSRIRAMAKAALGFSESSRCKRTKVAAILTNPDISRVYSMHCNRPDHGECNGNEGNCGCVHAEELVIKSGRSRLTTPGSCVLIITHGPCLKCAKLILENGIGEIYYVQDYRDQRGVQYLEKNGVLIRKVII